MNMKKILVLAIVTLIGMCHSCSEDWLNIKPKGQASIDNFETKDGVAKLLIGAYAVVDGTHLGANGTLRETRASSVTNWVFGSVAADDAYKGSTLSDIQPINEIESFYATANNLYVAEHWEPLYDGITRANDVLRVLPKVNDMTSEEKTLVEAQAKFLRAHFYFELTRVHGKVPYIDENTVNPGEVPNDHLLYPEIEADMKFAADNLPNRWSDKGRATEWAAKTYLARIYMFENKFSEALPIFRDVYTNGGFSLMPSYEQNYMIANLNNAESIFEIQYAVNDGVTGSLNAGGGADVCFPHGNAGLGTCCGFFCPSHSLVSAHRVGSDGLPLLDDTYTVDDILPFSPTGADVPYKGPVDPRLDHSVGRPGVPYLDWGIHKGLSWVRDANNDGPYVPKKNMFKKSEKALSSLTGNPAQNANNFRKFKLDQVILWMAECEAEVGSLHEAKVLVNLIRNRAKNSNVVRFNDGTPAANYKVEPYPVDFVSKEYARKAIYMEDRIEFAMEGERFFDLVRWGIAAQVLNNYMSIESNKMGFYTGRTFVAGQNEIWPIPQIQIDISLKGGMPILIQNPGY